MFVEELIPVNQTSLRAVQQQLFSLLQSCSTIKNLTQVHARIIVNGFTQKNFILAKLLSLYLTSARLNYAHEVFENIVDPSTNVWNQMIKGHANSEIPHKSIELYNRMTATEAEPDEFTHSYLLSACARSGLFREGEQIHGRVLANGYCSNVFIQTNLINLYTRAREGDGVGNARRVFDEMDERNVVSWNSLLAGYIRCKDVDGAIRIFDDMPEKSVVSWTTMIAGCAQNGRCKQALSLFRQMQRTGVHLDQVALVAVLSACAELGELKLGRWIHTYIEDTLRVRNQPLQVSLQNALIHMYASCGEIEEAYKVFKGMRQKSTVSWTSMITGFAKQGCAEEALSVFQAMQSSRVNDVKPDGITFIGVLCACSHAGLVDKGRQYFVSMNQNWGIKPRIEHYGCMVDLLSRAGFLNEAHQLIETMPMKPNDAVWGALLGGCKIHKNDELACHVAQKWTVELDPDQAAGYLVLLSNVYAIAKRWQDVAIVREKMVEMGVKKPPGRSWVQLNGDLHDFVAGDWNHKDASSIYEMLGEFTRQAKEEGYKPDISDVFLEVE